MFTIVFSGKYRFRLSLIGVAGELIQQWLTQREIPLQVQRTYEMIDRMKYSYLFSAAEDHDGVAESLPSILKLETVPECSENITEESASKITE